MQPGLLTIREVATKLKIRPATVYWDAEKGYVKVQKIKNRVLITPRAFELYKKRLSNVEHRPSDTRRQMQAEHIGANLRTIRLSKISPKTGEPYSQEELAKLFGCSQNTIKNLELNLRAVDHERLLKYKKFSGRTIDEILTQRLR